MVWYGMVWVVCEEGSHKYKYKCLLGNMQHNGDEERHMHFGILES
jgi:hypothetical protein